MSEDYFKITNDPSYTGKIFFYAPGSKLVGTLNLAASPATFEGDVDESAAAFFRAITYGTNNLRARAEAAEARVRELEADRLVVQRREGALGVENARLREALEKSYEGLFTLSNLPDQTGLRYARIYAASRALIARAALEVKP